MVLIVIARKMVGNQEVKKIKMAKVIFRKNYYTYIVHSLHMSFTKFLK